MNKGKIYESDFDRELQRNLTKFVWLLLTGLVVAFCILGVVAYFKLFT